MFGSSDLTVASPPSGGGWTICLTALDPGAPFTALVAVAPRGPQSLPAGVRQKFHLFIPSSHPPSSQCYPDQNDLTS